jgi:acyl-CoA synthetase (AMP-forming)/AMP-acid ligase II
MTEISKATVVWQALKDAMQPEPDRRAYIYQGREISFKEVDDATDHVACGLLNLGIKKGDRIGIIGLNQPEWIFAYFAAAKIGAVVVGLNVRYRDVELDYILNQSETRAVITLADLGGMMDYVAFFDGFRSRVPTVKDYIFIGGTGFDGSHTFDGLMNTPVDRDALDKAQASVTPDDLMIIIYTSGTTGRPKGAAITHKSQLASARAQALHTKITPDEMVPLALPFNHVGGITCGLLTTLLGRGACDLIPMFDPNQIIEKAKVNPPTIMPGVPTMHTLLLMNENISTLNSENVRVVITGGSNAEPALLNTLYKTFPKATVMNLYGLSESSGALVLSPWDSDFDTTVRSIGKPIGDFQVKVVDKQGNQLPAGEVGELYFKGDAVASEYFKMPDETAQTFGTDGWLRTGDMGYVDENGYITLMGRLKEMYIQGGFNVYPVEVENLLSKHPKVAMVAGIGVPDPVLGEIGRYYIVPKPGEEPTEDEIRAYCKEHMADYKVPKQIVFRQELPLTPVGKIMKAQLKEEYKKTGQ